jgi:sec-independent protein translocase protein TatB
MLGLSLPEVLFLAILALVVIGPKQLPEVARTVGRFLNELRRTSSTLTSEFRQQMNETIKIEEHPQQTTPIASVEHTEHNRQIDPTTHKPDDSGSTHS